jgi:integrase
MPRKRKDGKPARTPNKRVLTELYVQKLKPPAKPILIWDMKQGNLALLAQPSGHLSYKLIYSRHGRARWYTLGSHRAIGLAGARKLARDILYQVAQGQDPQAERKAQRSLGTFEELASRYVKEYASIKNKSWKQADALVRRHLLPKWSKLKAPDITRADVKRAIAEIKPIAANQTLAAASAIFAWAIKQEIGGVKDNPCRLVERNETKSRERVLSDSELPKFWSAFDHAGLIEGTALKLILLTGQRPGEVRHMRREHIVDGWWEMPGEPITALGWPGTKNAQNHRIWLPAPARALLAQLADDDQKTGFILAGPRGAVIDQLDAAMRKTCTALGVEKVTPHDLRRTHGTKITGLGFGRDAMNRIQNHREGGIASVYDRHEYADENKRVMETAAAHIMSLVEGKSIDNVVTPVFARQIS